MWVSWPTDRERTPEIRSGRAGSNARADRQVPRVSGPGIPGAGCEHGRSLAGGAHGSATQTFGRGKRRGLTGRVTGRSGPLVSGRGHAQARADGWGPPGSDTEWGEKGEADGQVLLVRTAVYLGRADGASAMAGGSDSAWAIKARGGCGWPGGLGSTARYRYRRSPTTN
jgi:hypothetical protein